MIHWKEMDRLAKAHHLTDPTISEKAITRFLRVWWCVQYNRPFKDPLLNEYTLDELVYEYLIHYYLDPKNDPKKKAEEEASQDDDNAWVKKMLEQQKAQAQAKENAKKAPPEISTKFD